MGYVAGQTFRVVPFGDLHVGHKLSSVRNFQQNLVNRYKDDKDTFFIEMGDTCDMIIAQNGDPRFQASMIDDRYLSIDNPVDQQIEDAAALLDPIKDRILAMVDSNHHLKILRKSGTHPTRRLAFLLWGPKEAEKRTLGYSGFMRQIFHYKGAENSRVRSLTWYLSHGVGSSSRTLGGPKNAIANVAKGRKADIFVFNHNHQLWDDDVLKLGIDRAGKVISTKEVLINGGCYKKSRTDDWDTSWEEEKEFPANAMGHMEVNIKLGRHSMDIFCVKRDIL